MPFDPNQKFTVEDPTAADLKAAPPVSTDAPAFDPNRHFDVSEPTPADLARGDALAPVIDVPARGPSYVAGAAPGEPGSELAPTRGAPGTQGAPTLPAMPSPTAPAVAAVPVAPSPAESAGEVPADLTPPSWAHTGGVAASKFLEGAVRAAALPMDLVNWMANTDPTGWMGDPFTKLGVPAPPTLPPQAQLQPIAPSGIVGQQVSRLYNAIGLPQPQTQAEKMVGDVSSALGSVAAPMGLGFKLASRVPGALQELGSLLSAAPLAQITGAIGSGVAGNIAERAGLSPTQQAIVSILAGLATGGVTTAAETIGRGTRAAVRPFSNAGQRQLAAEMLLRQSSDPATLQQRIESGIATPATRLPSAPATTGTVANDPALMVREQALRNQPAGQPIRTLEAQRNQAVADALTNLRVAPATTASGRGQVIRGALESHAKALNARTTQLYDIARQATGKFPGEPMLAAVARTARKFFGPGAGEADPAFRNIARQIVDHVESSPRRAVSAEWLMNMDRQIGRAARKARFAGDNGLGTALDALRDAVGSINTTPEYAAARAWRARVGRLMGRDPAGGHATGDIMRRADEHGTPMLADANVAARAVRDPQSVAQILQAGNEAVSAARASGAPADVVARLQASATASRQALRDQFLEHAESAQVSGQTTSLNAAGVAQTHSTYSPARWKNFWDANEQTAGMLFSKAEQRTLDELTAQLAETANVERTAAAKGSPTAQNLAYGVSGSPSTANVLMAMSRGRVDPDSAIGKLLSEAVVRAGASFIGSHLFGPLGGTAGMLPGSRILSIVFGHSDDLARAMLHDALANPALAQDLLAKASPEVLARVLKTAQGGWLGQMAAQQARAAIPAYGRAPTPPRRGGQQLP